MSLITHTECIYRDERTECGELSLAESLRNLGPNFQPTFVRPDPLSLPSHCDVVLAAKVFSVPVRLWCRSLPMQRKDIQYTGGKAFLSLCDCLAVTSLENCLRGIDPDFPDGLVQCGTSG